MNLVSPFVTMRPHDVGPPLSILLKKLEEKKGGLPRLLLGRLRWTVGLVVGVSRGKGRMMLQMTVYPQNRRKWSQIDVKPSCIKYLWH